MDKSIVYFCRQITPESVLHVYNAIGKNLEGKIAVKIHSGEKGNQNFIRPSFWQPIVNKLNGKIVECNTAYDGQRNTTEKHKKLFAEHGWSTMFDVDLMDEEGEVAIPVQNGKFLKQNFVGSHLKNYDSMLVLSHFKGHPMGGFGGALKNISIGIASSNGKALIHGAGDASKIWTADHDSFLTSMAEAASSVVDFFKENMVFVNVMCNMSVDCDCCAVAQDPKIADIGILCSLDPVAIDQACLDLVYNSNDSGKKYLIERIESRNGVLTVKAAEDIGVGTRRYVLKEI